MSIYTLLSTPLPTIAYCAMHQALPTVPLAEYMKTMKELHERIAYESEAINAEYTKSLRETLLREVQAIHGSLSSFLQTPISSDDKEVRHILEEEIGKFGDAVVDNKGYGLKYSVEGKVFHASTKKALEKKLLSAGKAYLEELGFTSGKGKGEIFESMFVVEGGLNLDILEHIVRDRLGIYSTTHGKHIKEFGEYAYTAYNLVHSVGTLPEREARRKYFEAVLFFSKPDTKYAPFRKALVDILKKLHEEVKPVHLALWQRKLGLGVGKEFALRVASDNSDQISGVVHWLEEHDENPLIKETLIRDGKLILKELLF